ncbi:6876_t:CDS:2 [Entrophospora sp. SA101]|nr:6876_t:CDS:2 [Entrophospora sp. SA101]
MTTEEQHLEEYRKLPVAITTEVESYAGWLMDAEKIINEKQNSASNTQSLQREIENLKQQLRVHQNCAAEKQQLQNQVNNVNNQLKTEHANCQKDKEQLAQQIKDHQTSQVEKEKLNQQITQLQQDKQDLQQQLVEAMAELTGAHQLEGELEAKIVQTSPFTEGGNK